MRKPVLLLAALLGACIFERPAPPLPAPPPAVITAFSVEPEVVERPGQSVRVSWNVTSATSVNLDQEGVGPLPIDATARSGSIDITVDQDTIFLLTARGEGGNDAQVRGVTVRPEARQGVFTALPPVIDSGDSARLVWLVAGAKDVTLDEVGGPRLTASGPSGQAEVRPTRTTRYRLQVDGRTYETSVVVRPRLVRFELLGRSPRQGESFQLAWEAQGASGVTLERTDLETPLLASAQPAEVAAGTFTDFVSRALRTGSVLTYRLTLSAGDEKVVRLLEVPIGGSLAIQQFAPPRYVQLGSTAVITWRVVNADSAELLVDGQPYYRASTPTEVAQGGALLPAPAQTRQLELVVRTSLGDEARASAAVSGVGPVAYNFFTASRNSIPAPGTPVTLTWSVANARRVFLTEVGGTLSRVVSGPAAESGSLTVYPNRAEATYQLEASNEAGSSINPARALVAVNGSVELQLAEEVPPGASTDVVGSGLSQVTVVDGLPTVEVNPAGERFVDISGTGTSTGIADGNTNVLVPIPRFRTVLFGTLVDTQALRISFNGILGLRDLSFFPPTDNTTSVIGPTSLFPLVLAPFWDNVDFAGNEAVRWQLDDVDGEQRLIVQWSGIRPVNSPVNARMSYQAQVYGSGKVVFAYANFEGITAFTPAVGIRNVVANGGRGQRELNPPGQPADGVVFRFFGPAGGLPLNFTPTEQPYLTRGRIQSGIIDLPATAFALGRMNISEVQSFPADASVPGQWFELTNRTTSAIDLTGWNVRSGSTSYTFPAGTTLPAQGWAVFSQAAFDLPDAGVNATALYGLGGTSLLFPNTAGTLILSKRGGDYDTLGYSGVPRGTSAQTLPPGVVGNSATLNSCLSPPTAVWDVANNQRGTPGMPNVGCRGYREAESIPVRFRSIAATGQRVLNALADEVVSSFVAPFAVTYFGAPAAGTTVWVSSNGWITVRDPGTGTVLTNRVLASTTATNRGSIAPFWDDIQATAAGGAFWQQFNPDGLPNSGDEELVVSFEKFGIFPQDASEDMNFQVVFYRNGVIEFHYGTMVSTAARATRVLGDSATVWLERNEGDYAQFHSMNSTVPGVQANTAIRWTPAN